MFDEAKRFIASLPNGLESFPECLCRSDIYEFLWRECAEVLSTRNWKPHVPPVLHTIGMGAWRSDVHLGIMHCLARDCFATEAEYRRFAFDMNMKLFQTPLMRLIVSVASSSLLVSGAAKRWAKMRQGTTLTHGRFETLGDRTSVDVTLVAPDGLYPNAFKIALASAYQAAAEVTKGYDSQVELSGGSGVTHFKVSWRSR